MNLSTSFKIKLKESKANITDIKEEDESDEVLAPTQRKSSTKYIRRRNSSKTKQQIKLVESENELDDDLNSSSESPSINRRPRVDRFLSIVEIPPEVVWLSQQKFAKQFSMPDIEETAIDETKATEAEPEVKKLEQILKKKTNKKVKKIDNKGKNSSRSNLNGSTLSQETKARIIKDIIRNYDIDYFMDELRAKDIVQIQLNKKLFSNF